MAKQRHPVQRLSHRLQVSELVIRGYSQEQIAAELGVDRSTISRDLRDIRAEWARSSLVNIDEERGRTLAVIDRVQQEYFDAWERSKQKRTTITEETSDSPKGPGSKSVLKVEEPVGDYAALAGVLQCEDRRIEIFGLSADTQIQAQQAVTNKTQVLLNILQAALPPEQLQVALSALRQNPEFAGAVEQVANTIDVETKQITPEVLETVWREVYNVE